MLTILVSTRLYCPPCITARLRTQRPRVLADVRSHTPGPFAHLVVTPALLLQKCVPDLSFRGECGRCEAYSRQAGGSTAEYSRNQGRATNAVLSIEDLQTLSEIPHWDGDKETEWLPPRRRKTAARVQGRPRSH